MNATETRRSHDKLHIAMCEGLRRTAHFAAILASGLAGCYGSDAVKMNNTSFGARGRSDVEIIGEHGEPDRLEIIRVAEIADEFRSELLNVYSQTDPVERETIIRELWWRHGAGFMVVWFVEQGDEWVAIDEAFYDPDSPP